MHGPLSEIGLADVLQLLERGRRSGMLRVVGPDPTVPRTILMHAGRVVAVEPDADDAAVDAGLAHRSLVTLKPEHLAHGPASISREIRDGLRRRLAARSLAAMLEWNRGRFDFEERPEAPGPLSLSPDALLLDLVEAEGRREALAPDTAEFHAVPDFAAGDAFEHGEPVRLAVLEWRILDAINGVRDVRGIATLLGEPLEDVAERIRDMTASAILVMRPPLTDEARTAAGAGNYDEAVRLLRARVATVPDDADAWRALGLAEVGAGRFDRAIEAWTSWQGVAPTHVAEAAVLIEAARTMLEAMRER